MTDTAAQDLLTRWKRGNVLAPDCPSRPILQHLTSRWGTLVMVALAARPHRFAELRRTIGGVSERMLSQTLKDLEADGFVLRTAHAVVPPHVDYELTSLGRQAAGHVVALTAWIEDALPQILAGATPLPPNRALIGGAAAGLFHALHRRLHGSRRNGPIRITSSSKLAVSPPSRPYSTGVVTRSTAASSGAPPFSQAALSVIRPPAMVQLPS